MWAAGGACASALLRWFSDYVLVVIDLADPVRPSIASTWWLPGMNVGKGERPTWPRERPGEVNLGLRRADA